MKQIWINNVHPAFSWLGRFFLVKGYWGKVNGELGHFWGMNFELFTALNLSLVACIHCLHQALNLSLVSCIHRIHSALNLSLVTCIHSIHSA